MARRVSAQRCDRSAPLQCRAYSWRASVCTYRCSCASRSARSRSASRSDGVGRVIAVGTTSLRLIESAAGEDGIVRPFEGDTSIFITPGYRFRGIDGLVTNFHLPRSTLFMLVSALMGLDRMQAAYAHAIESGYRFYSYGDASLLIRDCD